MRLPPYIIHDIMPQATKPWNLDQAAAPLFWPQSKGGGAAVFVIGAVTIFGAIVLSALANNGTLPMP